MAVTVFIYALIDPQSGFVKYVGKSVDPNSRYRMHLSLARRKRKTKCHLWVRSLQAKNLKPELFIIDEVPEAESNFWEVHYISLFKGWFNGLKNMTDGGDGGLRKKASKHQKETLSRIMKGNTHAAGNTNMRRGLVCYDGERFNYYESAFHASEDLKLGRTSINNNVTGRSKKVAGKYQFYYLW